MTRSRLALLGVGLLVLTGCNRFERSDAQEQRSAGAPLAPSAVEEGATTTTSATSGTPTTTAPASPGAAAGEPAVEPVPTVPPDPPGPVNAAEGVTDGLRIQVVAEHGPAYPSPARFRIQVTMENVSDRGRYHVVGQADFAALIDARGVAVWRSTTCNPTMAVDEPHGGAQQIMPGEEVTVVVPFPESDTDDQTCDLPDGSYTLVGIFPMCADEHVRETANPGTYRCEEGGVREYVSPGLPITIG